MQEKIGNVVLDYEYYPGEDLYSDGPVEEELLQIARNYSEDELNRVIAERKSWPVLYHFSHIRQNILEWIPMTGKDKVLEIGSGSVNELGDIVVCKARLRTLRAEKAAAHCLHQFGVLRH